VDGGRCFACHKNRGPILGGAPWSNTTQDDILRLAAAAGLRLTGSALPTTGPFAVQRMMAAGPQRARIDGMALATPEAKVVDFGVRLGANLRVNRDVFRLMTRTPDGRKALVILLTAVVGPGPLDPNNKSMKLALDDTFDKSFARFAADWVELQKETRSSVLIDADPAGLLVASGVRRNYGLGILSASAVRTTTTTVTAPVGRSVSVPGLRGGSGSRWAAPSQATRSSVTSTTTNTKSTQTSCLVSPGAAFAAGLASQASAVKQANDDLAATLAELSNYEAARSIGRHGLTSPVQPSNPRAFVKPPVNVPARPSSILNAQMLANTIGLTEGDREFLAKALKRAAERANVNQPRVTVATLAKQVFEGPAFADVLAGCPLPDRDEFKDRFMAGLDSTLKVNHGLASGLFVSRKEYASGPKYDSKAEEKEVTVAPTTACLRCHDIRPSGKPRLFEPIPALAFNPFDKRGREAWVKAADAKHKEKVLSRLLERLVHDSDMPPEDAPEYDRFRVKEEVAFDDVKAFLKTELEKAKAK